MPSLSSNEYKAFGFIGNKALNYLCNHTFSPNSLWLGSAFITLIIDNYLWATSMVNNLDSNRNKNSKPVALFNGVFILNTISGIIWINTVFSNTRFPRIYFVGYGLKFPAVVIFEFFVRFSFHKNIPEVSYRIRSGNIAPQIRRLESLQLLNITQGLQCIT